MGQGYRLAGVIKLMTAGVSWATVIALVPIVPRVLAMRSPEELEREIAARKLAEESLHRANADLEKRVQERTTELTQAVAALRDERELLHITLTSIGDGVIVTDAEGRVTFLNSVAENLTEWTTTEAQGVALGTVFHIVNEETRLLVWESGHSSVPAFWPELYPSSVLHSLLGRLACLRPMQREAQRSRDWSAPS